MSRNWTWFRPTTLDEVVGLLLAHGDDAIIVAGGTAVAHTPPRRDGLVMIDLQDLDLRRIGVGEGAVLIDALVTAQDLVHSSALDEVGTGMLRTVGAGMGPRPVRNRITVGGNVMQPFRWCDLPVAMLALDADLEVFGPKGFRQIPSDEAFAAQPRRQLAPGELLVRVVIPLDGPGDGACFMKLGWTEVDHAVASTAVSLWFDGDLCIGARVAVGAIGPMPQRLRGVEEALVGQRLDDAVIAAAVSKADPEKVVGGLKADEEYRRQVTRVLVRRAITNASDRPRSGLNGGRTW
jgi:carbon-monoxide dehydrogenase medium subunit